MLSTLTFITEELQMKKIVTSTNGHNDNLEVEKMDTIWLLGLKSFLSGSSDRTLSTHS